MDGRMDGRTDGRTDPETREEKFLLLVEVTVVARRQAMQHRVPRDHVAIDDTRTPPQELERPRVLLLRHHRGTHREAVVERHLIQHKDTQRINAWLVDEHASAIKLASTW